ncbi:MAG: HEAT repeat domain-containing protein [Ignavibacteria bacterium]|nr:HEAT repeat domain-containing protein [Ignavibacteria bacterium]
MRARLTLSLLSALMFLACGLKSQEVVRCPGQSLSLGERWKWASRNGDRSVGGKEFWVGYCIKRLMNEDSYVNSGNLYSGNTELRRSIYDIVSGDTTRRTTGNRTWGGTGRGSIVKVLKEVAILFRISGSLGDESSLKKLVVSNMELYVDLKKKPLLWLGGAEDDQSVGLLKDLFDQQSSTELKKDLLTGIGIHQNSREAFPFLVGVLKGEQADNIRAQAAFWLGQQNRSESLPVLMEAAQDDRSTRVKEQSVFAIGQLSSDESTEALITLARKARDTKVRAKAAFWLGQKASQKAMATLESIIADDEEIDVQRQALYALAQIHTSEVLDRLITTAKSHRNPRIRKQAIQCLGQSDDPRALDALIAIVRN